MQQGCKLDISLPQKHRTYHASSDIALKNGQSGQYNVAATISNENKILLKLDTATSVIFDSRPKIIHSIVELEVSDWITVYTKLNKTDKLEELSANILAKMFNPRIIETRLHLSSTRPSTATISAELYWDKQRDHQKHIVMSALYEHDIKSRDEYNIKFLLVLPVL